MFGNKQIRWNLACMTMCWIGAEFCYWLICFQLKYIKGDIYINGIVSSSSEVIAYLVCSPIFKKIGLKNILVMCFVLGSVGMILLLVVDT